MRKLQRHPEELGSLDLFADLDKADGSLSLQDVRRQQEVVARFRQGLSSSLANLSRTHGWRVQALFETVVVALGAARMLKTEDTGDCFYDEGSPVKLPDFRIVLEDGSTLLVEVKNVAPEQTETKVGLGELEALQRYAELNGARLVFAHYWARFNLWTLVDPVIFERRGGAAHVTLGGASMANEFVFLGDLMLGVPPPLTLWARADPSKPRELEKHREDFGSAAFTIGQIDVVIEDKVIADATEREVALAMIYFGGWEATETIDIDPDDQVLGAKFHYGPPQVVEEDDEQSGLPHRFISSLSSIYSAQFNVATLGEDGAPSKLRLEPGRIAPLASRDYWGREDRELPLATLKVLPTRGPRATEFPPG